MYGNKRHLKRKWPIFFNIWLKIIKFFEQLIFITKKNQEFFIKKLNVVITISLIVYLNIPIWNSKLLQTDKSGH